MRVTFDVNDLAPLIRAVVRETLTELEASRGQTAEQMLFSRREAAELLGVTARAIADLDRMGELRGVRVGRGKRYTRAELERLIAARSS